MFDLRIEMVEKSKLDGMVPLTTLFAGAISHVIVLLHHFGDGAPLFDFLLFS